MNRHTGRTFVSWIVISGVTILLLLAAGAVAVRILSPSVMVTRIVEGPVVQAFYSTGTVEPVREFPIKANHAGIITKMLVDKGDVVKIGQPLARVEEKELQFDFDKAAAELKEKMARGQTDSSPVLKDFDARINANADMLEIANRDQSRVTGLIARDAATQFDVDRANDRVQQVGSDLLSLKEQRATKLLELQKEIEVAQAAVALAQWNLDQQTVLSPTDGVVLDRPESIGTRVAVNDHLMQVADVRPENLVMRAQVDEEDKNKVRLDQTVRMTLYSFPDEVFQGKVARIYPKADSDRRTFEIDVILSIPNAKFAAGMTGELAFIMAEKANATVVPSQSLQQGSIYIVRDGKLAKADVTLGLKSVDRVEVLSGLGADDQIVVSPIATLGEGQRVRTQEVDPIATANLNKPKADQSSFKGFN